MADGRSIGTVFVELDLDPSRYTKGQQQLLRDAKQTSINIEDNFKALGIKSSAVFDLMREKIVNNYGAIVNNAKATANDILRAEQAKHAQIASLNEQQYGKQVSLIGAIKQHWMGASVAIVAAWATVNKALEFMDQAGGALQAESAFKIMADSANVNADRMIAAMRRATKETIDDSDLMQKSVKLMTLGFDASQIERFSNVVITASQIAGTTAAQAFDELGDALANRTPKAMIRMGAVTKDQMEVVTKAIAAGASETVLFELAMTNLEAKQKMLQGTQDAATISLQRFHTATKETQETIGKGLLIVVDALYRSLQFTAGAILGVASAYARWRVLVYQAVGDAAKEADARETLNTLLIARNDLLDKSGKAIFQESAAQARATAEEIAGAKGRVAAKMEEMRGIVAAADTGKKTADAKAKADEYYVRQVLAGFEEMEKAGTEFSQWQMKTLTDTEKKEAERATQYIKVNADANDQVQRDRTEFSQWYMKTLEAEQKKEEERVTLAVKQEIEGLGEIEKARLEFSQWESKQVEVASKKAEESWRHSMLNIRGITEDAFGGVSAGISGSIRGIIQGTQTLEQAFRNMGQNIMLGLLDSVVNRGLRAMQNALLDTVFGKEGGGGGGVNWAALGSSVASTASSMAGGIGSAVSSAISWLGSFDTGLWKVPAGKGTATGTGGSQWGKSSAGAMALVHPGEMIVPPDVAELIRKRAAMLGGSNWNTLAAMLGGGGRGGMGSGVGSYGAMTEAQKSTLGNIGTYGARGFGVVGGLLGAGSLGAGFMQGVIGSILGFEGVRGVLGVDPSIGYVSPTAADYQSMVDYGGVGRDVAARTEAAIGQSLVGDMTSSLNEVAAGIAAGETHFGGYGYNDPGYGGSPGMSGGATAGDSPGGPGADDGSGMSLARGGLFNTRGRTRMTVGEAGAETVAVLRNPREAMAGGGGTVVTVNIDLRGSVVDPQIPTNIARAIKKSLDRIDNRLIGY